MVLHKTFKCSPEEQPRKGSWFILFFLLFCIYKSHARLTYTLGERFHEGSLDGYGSLVILFDRKTFYVELLMVPRDGTNRRMLNDATWDVCFFFNLEVCMVVELWGSSRVLEGFFS